MRKMQKRTIQKVIGRYIGQARRKQKLSQLVVAKKIGTNQSHFSHCERGAKSFTAVQFLKACQALEISANTPLSRM